MSHVTGDTYFPKGRKKKKVIDSNTSFTKWHMFVIFRHIPYELFSCFQNSRPSSLLPAAVTMFTFSLFTKREENLFCAKLSVLKTFFPPVVENRASAHFHGSYTQKTPSPLSPHPQNGIIPFGSGGESRRRFFSLLFRHQPMS